MARISKKQRVALREIDKLEKERKRDRIMAIASIIVMVLFIVAYNTLVYTMGVLDEGNVFVRAMLYITAMVIAGFAGIKFMHSSRKTSMIDGYRQQAGISRETLEAWRRGEFDE